MALNISKKTSPQDVDSSAKGDLIVNNGSDIVSLPVGADGQIIEADSAESTGLKWSDKPLDTSAKGDLVTYDTAPALLSVGSDGQVLLADSSEPAGIKWAEFGGLNLTEVKYITTSTINKPPGTGQFSGTNPGGVFDFIGTASNTVAYSNPVTSDEVDILLNGSSDSPALVDKNYGNSAFNFTGTSSLIIDLKRDAYFNLQSIGVSINLNNAIRSYFVDGSNDGTNWDVLGENLNSVANGYISLPTNSNFYRYFRIRRDTGSNVTHVWHEFELFGEIIPDIPTYNILDADNNRMLLVPFGNPTQINMPTGIGANGFTCQITPIVSAALPITINLLPGVSFIGQNFTIDNIGEVATIVQASPDTYVVSISRGKLPLSAKGDLLSHDGNEPVVQTIGSDNSVLIADSGESTGIRWGDVSTIVSTPFTSQRLDLNNTLQLTGSNARYLYLSAVGETRDVVLTDPPSTNDFFYIVNRTGDNPIQIKEIAAGGVVQTLNNVTPAAQCHYDGVEWQVISFGSI